MNDNSVQQGGQPPIGDPSVAPAPDSTAFPNNPEPVMPGPSGDDSGLGNTVAMPPIVTPSIPAPVDPTAMPTEPVSAPAMPQALADTPEQQELDAGGGINGVSADSSHVMPDMPQISSNYAKSGSSDSQLTLDPDNDELLGIKQQALKSLAPLVDELDQTPIEKFKTTMMLIQASDNADLVKEAFSAANQIADEKTRAQALLDVVNEINYFTQPHTEDAEHESL